MREKLLYILELPIKAIRSVWAVFFGQLLLLKDAWKFWKNPEPPARSFSEAPMVRALSSAAGAGFIYMGIVILLDQDRTSTSFMVGICHILLGGFLVGWGIFRSYLRYQQRQKNKRIKRQAAGKHRIEGSLTS